MSSPPFSTDSRSDDDIVIVAATRTPVGRFLGSLSSLSGPQLGAAAIAGLLQVLGDDSLTTKIDAVIMGEVLQAGVGQNPAKQAALGGGVGPHAHTTTVNKVCLSGLSSIIDASRLLRSGEADLVIAGGMESMSNAPHLLPRSRTGVRFGNATLIDHLASDGLSDAALGISMGELTEQHADAYPVTRAEQDEFSARSHQRAVAARDSGVFEAEITPVTLPARRGKEPTVVSQDEGIRDGVTPESLGALLPAFHPEGSITAGSSSQLSDGAAAVMLCRRRFARHHGLRPMCTLRAVGQVAGPDSSLQHQPAAALAQALQRQGWSVEDLDAVEYNEAFAAVAVYSARMLNLDLEKLNVHGGAIALGHPIGASGARLVVHLAHQLAQNTIRRAGAALCGGGGQGEAILLESP